jgi:DNA-binding transcriptional MocR family regulator
MSATSAPISYGQYRIPPADECVNFGVGQPAPSMLPLARVRAAAATKLAEEDPLLLQYGAISGYPAFRATLADFLSRHYAREVDPDLLFVTNGISGGLALLTGALGIGAGDVVVVEEPSYFLALAIFRDAGLRIVSVKVDESGMDTA